MQYVEQDSVESAIRMIDYYEETYRRIQETIVTNSIGETKEAWLSLLGEKFTSGDAVIAGRKVDMSRRSVYYALDQLCRLQHPLIEKLQHGVYRKLMTENTYAPCTIALSSVKILCNLLKVQKCRVQQHLNQRTMGEYRFHLQKYKPGTKTTCPSCGKSRCFVRYIDELGSIIFPNNVGKCDHENSCGYHYTPKEYFKDNPDKLEMNVDNGKPQLFS